MMQDWLRSHPEGIEIKVRVSPGSAVDRVEQPLQHGDHWYLTVRVRENPEKGKANAAVERVIAEWLDLAKSKVRVISGNTARLKTVRVAGDTASLMARATAGS